MQHRIRALSPHISVGRRFYQSQTKSNHTHFNNVPLSQVYEYAKLTPTPVSLQNLNDFGENPTPAQLLQNAQFLHREIPIRVAHRIKELDNMPYGLSRQSHVMQVRDIYMKSFGVLRSIRRPETEEQEFHFTTQLNQLLRKHKPVVPMISRGLKEIREEYGAHFTDFEDCPYLVDFLDRFFIARIGLRFIARQHGSMHTPVEGFVGILKLKCSPAEVIQDAVEDASTICTRNYGDCPEVNIHDPNDTFFTYPKDHLHYMLIEIVKNSMRAVMESHPDDPPPIDIVIVGGDTEITIKVSDQGGGIPRSLLSKIWTYTFTTAKEPPNPDTAYENDFAIKAIGDVYHMAGFGYGLPLTRLYSRYFGGDLQVISMHGHGTDAYLYLPRLANSKEYVT